jgi:predicted GNAT family acetyltransferase
VTADSETTPAADAISVADNPAASRYEAHLGDRVAGFSEYVTKPGRLVFTHTIVEPEFEGRGIGSKLVRDELDDVRRRGLKVTPLCPFVRAYIRRHPEYQDLVATADDRSS